MNKLLFRTNFCEFFSGPKHCPFFAHWSRNLNTSIFKDNVHFSSDSTTNPFKIESIGIKSTLKKIAKYESFVYRSFFGELDPDYLSFPTLTASVEESRLLTEQYRFIRENFFVKILNDQENFLKRSGFLDLSSLSETEKIYLFEALGSSIEYRYNDKKGISKDLITLDKLTITNSFLVGYQEKKKYIQSILHLLIHNSLVLNAIESSNNNKIKDDILLNFKEHRIAFAFDEPFDDNFFSPPHPYWNSTAIFDNDTNTWTLNGKKSRILENKYDYFLIFCKLKKPESNKTPDEGITSFVVPNNRLTIENDGTDNYGTNYLKISFNNLNLSKESELLISENATSILNIKSSGQLMTAAVLLGIMKNLFENSILIANSIVPYKNLATNYLSIMAEMIYGLESMLYLTSSHYDTFELDKIDLYLQALIVQIMAAEYSQQMINIVRFLFGSKHALMAVSNDINDVLNVFSCFPDSCASNRMLLASYGLRSIGNWRFDHIAKMRLRQIYKMHFLKYNIKRFKDKINLRFEGAQDGVKSFKKLNPELKEAANQLKQALNIESESGNRILEIYGKECVKYQIDMNRFASIIMNTFQMVSVISRANHSLAKRKPFSSQESLLCKNICKKALVNSENLQELIIGIVDISEEKRSKIIHTGNIRFNGYFAKPTFDRVT